MNAISTASRAVLNEGTRYRDLAQRIRRDILSGKLRPGNRLPSIRTCAQMENLSPGTVKHAYSLLAEEGLIEMVQGRGSLVKSTEKKADPRNSSQEQAMTLIDKTIDSLLTMGFPLKIVQIFMDLKLKARIDSGTPVRVAVIERCPEIRRMITGELLRLQEVDLVDFDSSEMISNPTLVQASADLAVTSSPLTSELQRSAQEKNELLHLALTPSNGTIIRLMQKSIGQTAVLLSNSSEFAKIMQEVIHRFCGTSGPLEEITFGNCNLRETLAAKKAPVTLVVPHDYELFCSQDDLKTLNTFAKKGGNIVKFKLVLDQGSNLFLESKLQSIRHQKQLESIE